MSGCEELSGLFVSMVNTPPYGSAVLTGSSVHPSSALESALFVPERVFQVKFEGFRRACPNGGQPLATAPQLPSIKGPSCNTTLCASPIPPQAGGDMLVQVLV